MKWIVVVIALYNNNIMEETETYISCLAWIHKGYAAKVPR
jgi:hypothetical protein